ncbi:hypothetical protein NLX86_29585 [Streptomyces sp. A3M-1-3]|uniref:hypothetical protein n=1 Tax=Streptomyces sp. A3M-1-3 TaxID=2962044 RepID=UPI0020B786D9|nr:hypothetical protein [Streptomyces sp. A3M-1-3]MCP3822090.1 hypothetical protein [Streptomyces sp. A3M-1-3]
MPELPTPTRLSPIRDDHAWHFPDINGHRTHVRLRVWPTKEGGHLVVATDLELGAGLINVAESLVRACVREFGPSVTVVRHFTPYTMSAFERDSFDVLTPLDEKGIARPKRCTEEILKLLGASVVGFPGDAPPGPADAEAPVVGPQSVHLARLVAASLRLTQTRVTERRPNGYPTKNGPVAEPDLDAISQLRLTAPVLNHLSHFVGGIVADRDGTAAGAKREKKLARVVEALQKQAWALTELCDELVNEEREQS